MKGLIIGLFFALVMVGFVSATPSPVAGTIFLANGSTVSGATVSVTCQHLGDNTTLGTTSIVDGSYSVLFSTATCGYNDLLWVTAFKDSMSGSNTGQMCDSEECFIPIGLVDVTIPEFGLVGAMLVVIAGISIVAYKRIN
jgi:hypothetical protein